MNLLDKLKGKNIARQWQWEKENNRATAARTINQRDYISEIEKIIENGKIKKNDFVNVVQPSHITTMIKKIHSLDEQNTYLQKYLKEMVNENEKITGELNDVQETLKAAKSSLAELTTEIQNMYAKQEEMDLNQIQHLQDQVNEQFNNPQLSAHIEQQQLYYEEKNNAVKNQLKSKINQIQMSMQKEQQSIEADENSFVAKPIEFQVKLSDHSEKSDGASTPIEDDSEEENHNENGAENGGMNLNKKINSIKNKYDDDRNKIKGQNIQDQADWNSEQAITHMQDQINLMREEIQKQQEITDKEPDEINVKDCFVAFQEILDKLSVENKPDKTEETKACLAFYDNYGKLWHIIEDPSNNDKEVDIFSQPNKTNKSQLRDSAELLKMMNQNKTQNSQDSDNY